MTLDRKTFLTYRRILVAGALGSFLLFALRALLWPSSGDETFKSPAFWAMAFAGVVVVVVMVVAAMNAAYAWANKKETDSGVAKDREENAAEKSTDSETT